MKKTLPLLIVVLLFGACNSGTKMQLRAPQTEVAERKAVSVKDSVKIDSTVKK